MQSNRNVIWCDFNPGDAWNFHKGLSEQTGLEWDRVVKINNDKSSKSANVKRYFGYFWFSWRNFIHRSGFKRIIAWQQFYGLIFAFFCRLFNVKKTFELYIMIFIYIPKSGLIGRIYQKFMSYIVTSRYIDKIFVFSSSESKRYERELGVSASKFVFMPFGDDIEKNDITCTYEPGFIFSSGYSNRDFDFLVDALKDEKFITRIFGWEDYRKGNVIVSSEVVGNRLDSILNKCKLVVVPLKENRESGQFTIIHAMEAGIPVIATDTDCMKDYIINGVNGFILPNDKELWIEKIRELYDNTGLYNTLSINCQEIYKSRHTQIALGKNIGLYIGDKIENEGYKNTNNNA